MILFRLLTAFLLLVCYACASSQSLDIVDKPIIFDEEREALSLQYMKEHYGIEADEPTITPTMIVVHWTAIPTFEGSFNAFYNTKLPSSRTGIKGGGALNVSVPYLIDQDGTIYQLMPDTLFARHVIGLNHTAIGIENVGDDDKYPLTEAQYEANLKLIRYLGDNYNIDYVIGHHEYQKFKNYPLWLEKDPNYLTEKSDPGDAFMERLRDDLKDLDLKPLPEETTSQTKPIAVTNITQGIQGQVIWLEGNQMPGIRDKMDTSTAKRGKGVQRTIFVYELTNRQDAVFADGFFSEIRKKPIKQVQTDENGYFAIPLETGRYSVFVKEEKGLYANLFDGEGNIQPIKISPDRVQHMDIKVDYNAAY